MLSKAKEKGHGGYMLLTCNVKPRRPFLRFSRFLRFLVDYIIILNGHAVLPNRRQIRKPQTMTKRNKRGLGYLTETTVDCTHGIITGMDVYPANQKESGIILRHLERQMQRGGFRISKLALDGGYDIGAIHRGLELLGITGYIPAIPYLKRQSRILCKASKLV